MALDLVGMLRRQNEEKETLANLQRQNKVWQKQAETIQPATVGGQAGYGGIPTPVEINYGGLLGNALNTFMSARTDKKLQEATARNEKLSQEFMADVVKDDPEAQRLLMGAQLKIPGFEKALENYVAPKKEKINTFVTNARNYPKSKDLTPEQRAEIKKVWGVGDAFIDATIDGAHAAWEAEQGRKEAFDLKKIGLEQSRQDARAAAQNATTLEAARTRAKGKEKAPISLENPPAYTPDGKPDFTSKLDYGDGQFRNKAMKEIDAELQGVSEIVGEIPAIIEGIKNVTPQQWRNQRMVQYYSEKGPAGELIAKPYKVDALMRLDTLKNNVGLKRMAILSGPDSDKDWERNQADLPSVFNSKEEAEKALERIGIWYEATELALEMKRDYYDRGEFKVAGSKNDFYKRAKAIVLERRRNMKSAMDAGATSNAQQGITAPGQAPAPGSQEELDMMLEEHLKGGQ